MLYCYRLRASMSYNAMVATCKRKPTTDERRKTIDRRARGYGYDRRYSRCSPRRRNWKLETRNSKHRSGAEFLCTIILRMIQIQICTRYKVFYTSTNKLIRVCHTQYFVHNTRQQAKCNAKRTDEKRTTAVRTTGALGVRVPRW